LVLPPLAAPQAVEGAIASPWCDDDGTHPPTDAEILAARVRAGLTQAEAAARVGADARSWRRWEAGVLPRNRRLRMTLRRFVEGAAPQAVLMTDGL
jgi:hypothetical protein